ncbi:MAG: isochorismate synthase [Flavobacteriaceae bacterium]|nr:isochorismate synthase [Flavobacteriaceae bacterium]
MQEDSFFEAISNHYKNELPFVVYCKPFSFDIMACLQKDNTLYKINDFSESGFVFSPFDFRKDSILIPFSRSQQIKLSSELNTHGLDKQYDIPVETNKEQHLQLVQKALDCIKNKEFEKLVVSREEIITIPAIDVIRTLKRLLINYNGAFVYCWFHPQVGLWLGASPESLIKIKGNQFETMALAGTQPYSGTLDVKWSNKDREEQQIVSRYIKEVMEPYLNNIIISESKTVKAGKLIHLRTDISAQIPDGEHMINKLILQLHPTPAVCGMPKLKAIQFIIDNESYNREFYTGFLGELNKEAKINERLNQEESNEDLVENFDTTTDLYVNLRCMQIRDNQARLFVGGGITIASDPELEWEETVHKAKTMKSVIAF